MYILGVDGGGTKIEFVLASLDQKPLFEYRLERNTNLKYTTAQKVIEALQDGLAAIEKDFDLSEVEYTYLGIAECGPKGVGKNREAILKYLESKFRKFDLQDDQYSVFMAGAPTNVGVLANAGTGSNINKFTETQEWSYKSLGIGGRDFGKLILGEVIYNGIKPESEIYKSLENFLEQKPEEFYNNLEPFEKIKNKKIPQIPKVLLTGARDNDLLREELHVYELFVANRWSTKLAAYLSLNFGYGFHESFDLVLSGSMWKWDTMRWRMIEDLKRVYPSINTFFDPDLRPVLGCIELAANYCNFKNA